MASGLFSNLFQHLKHRKKSKWKAAKKYSSVELKALTRSLVYVCDNVTNLNTLCMQLISEDVITDEEREEIFNTQHTDRSKMEKIITRVSKRGTKGIQKFKDALNRDNPHILEHITEQEEILRQNNDAEEKDDEESLIRAMKKKKKKKGKMFSVYAASDSEDSDSDEEFDFDDENPDIEHVLKYFLLMEYYVGKLHYHHRKTPYTVQRFKKSPVEFAVPDNRFQKSFQCFKTNRSVFLEKVGFYGPRNIAIASYQVKVTLSIWNSFPCRPCIPVAGNEEIIEVRNGEIMHIYLSKTELPQPIRPHTWHAIHFTINGEDAMKIQSPENKLQRNFVTYDGTVENVEETNDFEIRESLLSDKVKFEFQTCCLLSTCQLPELCFYQGKPRLSTGLFPKVKPITKLQKKQIEKDLQLD